MYNYLLSLVANKLNKDKQLEPASLLKTRKVLKVNYLNLMYGLF